MKKLWLLLSVGICFLSVSGCGRKNQSGMISIIGSDTMVNLVQAWAEEYMKENQEAYLAVTGGGSGTGIASLISGTCDITATSREMNEKEMQNALHNGIRPVMYKVALDGIAVAVHPSNPVEKLTIDQLSDIFSGEIANWKTIGGRDSLIVVLSREVNSGTHIYFKEHILRKGVAQSKKEFAQSALLLSSSQSIVDEITQNPQAIGYYGMGYINPSQKTLHVARDARSLFFAPNIDNVISGKYPISRPLFLYVKDATKKEVNDFINFILSGKGQQIVKDTDFVPVK